MEIVLKNNLSERNELNKNLTEGIILEGSLRNATSIIAPSLSIEYDESINSYNYCYIPVFSRYYYIDDILSLRNDLWLINCRVDVLMSFRDDILNSVAILEESTVTGASNYLSNDVWNSLVKDTTTIIPFSSGLNNEGEYILITAGG